MQNINIELYIEMALWGFVIVTVIISLLSLGYSYLKTKKLNFKDALLFGLTQATLISLVAIRLISAFSFISLLVFVLWLYIYPEGVSSFLSMLAKESVPVVTPSVGELPFANFIGLFVMFLVSHKAYIHFLKVQEKRAESMGFEADDIPFRFKENSNAKVD